LSEISSGWASSRLSANTFPSTLKTVVSGPNGSSSVTPGRARHQLRSAAASITFAGG
jgi:hypothetical protein